MANVKVKIYTPGQQYVGYLLNPTIEQFPEAEYEISGRFYDENNDAPGKLEFNPEALPYWVDLSELEGLPHKALSRVFIQRGRQPVRMTGLGSNG